jgi:IS5 family transposase
MSDGLIDQIEKIKTSIRTKEVHYLRLIKRQFGFANVLYRSLVKNTLQIKTLFVQSKVSTVQRSCSSVILTRQASAKETGTLS